MSSKTGDDGPLSDAQLWAAQQLCFDEPASPGEAKARVLRKLAECDFLPAPFTHRAIQTLLADRPIAPLSMSFEGSLEDFYQEQIEDLASRFFLLEPAPRQQAWQHWRSRADHHPRLRARLEDLRPGVAVSLELSAGASPRAELLRGEIARAFTLPPSERPAHRRQLFARASEDPASWGQAARWLRDHHPQIAGLVPTLIEDLTLWKLRCEDANVRKLFRSKPVKVAKATEQAREGDYRWLRWLVTPIVVIGMRGLFTHLTSTKPPAKPIPVQNYRPPTAQMTEDIRRGAEKVGQTLRERDSQRRNPFGEPLPPWPEVEREPKAKPIPARDLFLP